MAKKFLIVIAAIAAVMAALALAPGLSNQGPGVSVDYSREHMYRTGNGTYASAGMETLKLGGDGSGQVAKLDGSGTVLRQRQVSIAGEDLTVLRELFLNTGFMQISGVDSGAREGVANYTRYHLSAQSGEKSQSMSWVDPDASAAPVPAITVNAGQRLDAIIDRQP